MKAYIFLLTTSLLLTACFRTRGDISRQEQEKETRQSIQQSLIQQSELMERMQADMGKLQGRLEELEYNRKKEQGNLSSGQDSLYKRISEMQDRMESMGKTQEMLVEEIKRLKEENLQLLKGMDAPKNVPLSAPTGASTKGVKKKDLHGEGLNAFRQKDYETTVEYLEAYLKAEPKGKHAISASFHLGEAYFAQKKYSEAILAYGVAQERSPKTSLGRKSALKMAESFHRLGKANDAKAFAKILQELAPASAEAKAAKRFL